jgi:hypothetical protein
MLFTFVVDVIEFIMAKWHAFIITVYEDMKKKEICNEERKCREAIDAQAAEQRVRDDRAREICELINQSEMVKTIWTRLVMLENCVQQHENRVRQFETEKAVLEKRIYFDGMIICFLCAGLILVNRGI